MDPYKTTFESWDNVASFYQDTFMELELYNDTYDRFCELVQKQNAKIFEIACGPGNITRYLATKRADFKIDAIDIAQNMLELAEKNVPSAKFSKMDVRDIHTLNEKYDGVMCGFCLPYLSKEDVAKLVADCTPLLNEQGVIYLSAIEDDYSKSGYETSSKGDNQMYVYYHQEDYLSGQLKKNGFESIEIARKSYTTKAGKPTVHLIVIARRK